MGSKQHPLFTIERFAPVLIREEDVPLTHSTMSLKKVDNLSSVQMKEAPA